MRLLCLIFLYIMIVSGQAQLPQVFIKNASIQHDDTEAFDVAEGADGTVFVAYSDGLRAYHYNGQSFSLNAYIYNDGEGVDLTIGPDGTIFLANMWDGLRAYTYDESSFSNTAHRHDEGDAHGVAIGPDSTIFLANLWNGLWAYTYNGSSFNHRANIHTSDDAHDVAVGPDGTVFVANDWDGLRAYSYDEGNLFSLLAHIYDDGDSDGRAVKVAVDSDGTVFLGNSQDGLRAYTFDGNVLYNTAHIDNGGEAWGIAVNSDGTVFLANDYDGLRAYEYNGSSFTNTAHIKDGNRARDLAIGADGTVFLASRRDGVFAYTYTGYNDIPYFSLSPNFAFQNNNYNSSIQGINTHFAEGSGVLSIWLSRDDREITAHRFQVHHNTALDAEFAIPQDVPIGHWDMHIETAVDSVITVENALDIVLNGNYALQFDGYKDFVIIPEHDSLDMAGSSVSVSAWIKSSAFSDNWNIILEHGQGEPGSYSLFSWDSNHLRFEFVGMDEDIEYTVDFTDGNWHHVVGTFDSKNNRARLYYDGKQVVSKYVYNEIEEGSGKTTIGSWGGEHSFFEGEIDEIRIWKKALTLEEIQANMYRHLKGSEDGLVGYWPANAGTDNILYDLSGNHISGTVQGATWTGSGAPLGTAMVFCLPEYAYQNHNFFTKIQGVNTHFLDEIESIWLSNDQDVITIDSYQSISNTEIKAKFYIPADVSLDRWGITVQSRIDSIITMPYVVEILSPPSVTSQNSVSPGWLRSVYAINDRTCWSVGNDGTIQKTIDGGSTWKSQTSGTSNVLYSVFFLNDMTGWIVGQYGTILNTINGGEEWHDQNSGTTNNLQSVFFVNDQTGWTVGRYGTILKTTNGSVNWQPQISGTNSWLYSLHFIDMHNGWAVGSNGTILYTSDGGVNWDPQISGTSNYLSSVYFYDLKIGWIVGSNGTILRTTDGGENWMLINSNTTEWLKSVCFADTETGWAVGTDGVLIMTLDGGKSWSPRRTWTNSDLNSVYFADEITGWAVGETGTILNLLMNNLATAIDEKITTSPLPYQFKLYQNFPNPFNPNTMINYQLPITNDVELSIYNLLGQKVATLVNERKQAGFHQVEWDGSGFASGVYYYRLRTDAGFVQTKKLVLLK